MEKQIVRHGSRWVIAQRSYDGINWHVQSRGRGYGSAHTIEMAIVAAGWDEGIGPMTYRTKREAEEACA